MTNQIIGFEFKLLGINAYLTSWNTWVVGDFDELPIALGNNYHIGLHPRGWEIVVLPYLPYGGKLK